MSDQSPHALLKRLQELNPHASAAELRELFGDELQRSPEGVRKAVFDDVFDAFVKETGHRSHNDGDTMEQLLAWLKKPNN